jgi:hypothetical protein
MNSIDYRKRLGLNFNDLEKEARFYAQMHNFFVGAGTVEFDRDVELIFCNKIGVKMKVDDPLMDTWDAPTGLKRAWIYMKKCETDMEEFLFRCVELINSYSNSKEQKIIKSALIDVLLNALNDCQIAYDVISDEDGMFIFPKGAKELDDSLISQPLLWLSNYPNARNAFIKALKEYSGATTDNASDVADKFRKALETFFQEFFGGGRSLENYKSDYGTYLKARNIPKEISGNLETLMQAYMNFMNQYAKHHDATSDKVLEYIMYQTGNIIRLLITLKQEVPDYAG